MAECSTSGLCVLGQQKQALYPNKRLIGLDPVFRSCVKMRIKDFKELHLVNVEDASNSCGKIELYCFKKHVVNKVEVMGIVVMVNRKEKFNSFAVDDGTGVILCMHWKRTRNASKSELFDEDLPASLQQKYLELQGYDQSKDENGVALGDLVQVRGWVTTYHDQREIRVLDYRTIDNPSVEMEAILEHRSIYKIYENQFIPPSVLTQQMAAMSASTFNEFAVRNAISGHITNCGRSLTTVTPHEILLWPTVNALIAGFKEEETIDNQEYINIIKTALQSLESTKGSVYQLSGSSAVYEIIKARCPMAGKVLAILKSACQIGNNGEDGCHILHLKTKLKNCRKYSRVQDPVMIYLLSCLEDASDVICTKPKRYIYVS